MEKLHKGSDGLAETQSGFLAVVPRIHSGRTPDGEFFYFEYKANVLGPVTRVEWPSYQPFCLIKRDQGEAMLRLNFASPATDEQIADFNAAVDTYEAQQAEQPPKVPQQPAPAQTPKPAEQPKSGEPAPHVPGSDPLAAARAEGWQPHPDSPGFHYKGSEVVADDELAKRFAPAPALPKT